MTTVDTTTFTDREAFVWLGFRRDASLEFRVTLPRDDREAQRILNAVDCYNAFEPSEAWRIIDGWRQYLMRVDLAREGSVAMYFTFPWYQHQAWDEAGEGMWLIADAVTVPTDTCRVFADAMSVELRDAGAEETSYNPTTRTLRAWWD